MIHDAQKAGFVQISTRSQAKRATANGSCPTNSSIPSVVKSVTNQMQNLPYNVSLKGSNAKGISTGRSSRGGAGNNKHPSRSKVMTLTSLGPLPNADKNSHSYQQSIERSSLVQGEQGHEIDMLQQNIINTMPSLTKQNQQSKNKGQISVSRAGAKRNRGTHETASSLIPEHNKDELTIITNRAYNSRSRVRHQSVNQGPEAESHSINMSKQEHIYLTKNISRVKRRLEVSERSSKIPGTTTHRNNSQLVSRATNEDKAAALEKNMLQLMQSRAAMQGGEKTTAVTDDESQKQLDDMMLLHSGAPPTPVIEEKESPVIDNKPRRFSTQSSPRASLIASHGRRSIIPAATHQLAKAMPPRQSDLSNRRNQITKGPGRNSVQVASQEKRLKNSETCPEHILPNQKQTGSRTQIRERSNLNLENATARTKPTNVKKDKVDDPSSIEQKPGLQKSSSQEQSMTRLPVSRKQTARDEEAANNKRQQMQQKAQMIQLRNFRNMIDGRRSKNSEQQPLELREFQIGLQIGQGAFAIVRRATHKETKHVIAIKTYDKKNLQDKEAQMAVHREINTLSDLWHPTIMKLHEVVDQRTQVHLVMEMCAGSSVFHHIKKQPDQRLPQQTCQHIFKQLVRGVAYMHSKGYAHRDLKLDNILMDFNSKNIKIIDFGFSQRVREDEKLSIYCGTPHYMDPDIVRKTPYNPFAADVWACGVILYIIYVGKLPFFGEFEADLFRKIQCGKFTQLPNDLGGDEKVKALFRRMFDTNPATRITAQQLVEHSWIKDTELSPEQEQEILREAQQQEVLPAAPAEENKVIVATTPQAVDDQI